MVKTGLTSCDCADDRREGLAGYNRRQKLLEQLRKTVLFHYPQAIFELFLWYGQVEDNIIIYI